MTVRTTSWRAITGRRWRKCFSTSPAAASRKVPDERARGAAARNLGPSHRRDDPALLVSVDVVVAAATGIDLLAGAADHHLGFSAELYLANVRVFRPRRRHPDRRRDPVGHPVSRPA